jgi:hypothetical protein
MTLLHRSGSTVATSYATGHTTVLVVAVVYLVWVTIARWRFIMRPLCAALVADASDLRALLARGIGPPSDARAMATLLGPLPGKSGELEVRLSTPKFGDRLSWNDGTIEEAMTLVASAQAYVPAMLPDEEVIARLVVARAWLKEYESGAEYVDLGNHIDTVLGNQPSLPPAGSASSRLVAALTVPSKARTTASGKEQMERCRALLGQALVLSYERPNSPFEMIWNRKTALVLVVGLTAVVLLAYAVNVQLILLFGATGGILQRLWQFVYERDAKNTDPLYWSTLFLAPVAGALAAVGGLYLITLLNALNIFGSSIKPIIGLHGPVTTVSAANLGIAFLLGFSARLLGTLAARSESAVTPASPAP